MHPSKVVNPTSVIFQVSIYVPVVAFNTLCNDASCYLSDCSETNMLHSERDLILFTSANTVPHHIAQCRVGDKYRFADCIGKAFSRLTFPSL